MIVDVTHIDAEPYEATPKTPSRIDEQKSCTHYRLIAAVLGQLWPNTYRGEL